MKREDQSFGVGADLGTGADLKPGDDLGSTADLEDGDNLEAGADLGVESDLFEVDLGAAADLEEELGAEDSVCVDCCCF